MLRFVTMCSWPYLEKFTIDATREVLAELGGKPDFVIGQSSAESR